MVPAIAITDVTTVAAAYSEQVSAIRQSPTSPPSVSPTARWWRRRAGAVPSPTSRPSGVTWSGQVIAAVDLDDLTTATIAWSQTVVPARLVTDLTSVTAIISEEVIAVRAVTDVTTVAVTYSEQVSAIRMITDITSVAATYSEQVQAQTLDRQRIVKSGNRTIAYATVDPVNNWTSDGTYPATVSDHKWWCQGRERPPSQPVSRTPVRGGVPADQAQRHRDRQCRTPRLNHDDDHGHRRLAHRWRPPALAVTGSGTNTTVQGTNTWLDANPAWTLPPVALIRCRHFRSTSPTHCGWGLFCCFRSGARVSRPSPCPILCPVTHTGTNAHLRTPTDSGPSLVNHQNRADQHVRIVREGT